MNITQTTPIGYRVVLTAVGSAHELVRFVRHDEDCATADAAGAAAVARVGAGVTVKYVSPFIRTRNTAAAPESDATSALLNGDHPDRNEIRSRTRCRDLAARAELTDLFGPAIHTYTRSQAIADGVLIPLPAAGEAGFKWPVAITAAAHAAAIAWSPENGATQDEEGRAWDVLTMARHAVANGHGSVHRRAFRVLRLLNAPGERTPRLTDLVLASGPGDDGAPVLTIMLPDED